MTDTLTRDIEFDVAGALVLEKNTSVPGNRVE